MSRKLYVLTRGRKKERKSDENICAGQWPNGIKGQFKKDVLKMKYSKLDQIYHLANEVPIV